MRNLMGASVLILSLFQGVVGHAATRSWIVGAGLWSTPGNWSGGLIPAVGDDVLITNAGAYVEAMPSTPTLNSLTLGGNTNPGFARLVFTNWDNLLATTVNILSNGYVTVLTNSFTGGGVSNRVFFYCSNLTVYPYGQINVDGLGYMGGAASSGNGPGGGQRLADSAAGGGAGGTGGDGGDLGGPSAGGAANGNLTAPETPGSGGGGVTGGKGGAGGGVIRIQAGGTVTVDGAISAKGLAGEMGTAGGGGGSGGAIWIVCNAFAGSDGMIQALGGTGAGLAGAGGGGRIAVTYNTLVQSALPKPGIRVRANPGSFTAAGTGLKPAGQGTIYFPDTAGLNAQALPSGNLNIPAFTNLSVNNLLMTNVWLTVSAPTFSLRVTNTFLISGFNTSLQLSNAVIHCGGNLTLSNGGSLYIYAGPSTLFGSNYGALVSVTGDLQLVNNAWIYPVSHPTNNGSVLFRARNVNIASATSGFNADAAGYRGGVGNNAGATNGFGPGNGKANSIAAGGGGGGGYGGAGGNGNNGTRGSVYGSLSQPMEAGSGGGAMTNIGGLGGNGGGLIWVESRDQLSLSGVMRADGGSNTMGGGGSGGGIYARCKTFQRNAGYYLSARGGASTNGWIHGGGGGGRIAVWRAYDTLGGPPTSNAVTPGIGYNTGVVGTVYWGDLPDSGVAPLLLIRAVPSGVNTSATLSVWNRLPGAGPMGYTLSANVAWLSLSSVSGTSSGETNLVTATFLGSALSDGSYSGLISMVTSEGFERFIPLKFFVGSLLGIAVNPTNGTWTITSAPTDYEGATNGVGSLPATGVPTGIYTVAFGDIPEWNTPAPQTVTVGNSLTMVNGLYQRQTGTLSVDVMPDTARWGFLSYPSDYLGVRFGTGDIWNVAAPIGSYTLAFAPLPGYLAPSNITLNVVTGQTALFQGIYPRAMGRMRIEVMPTNARWAVSASPLDYTGPRQGTGSLASVICPTGPYAVGFLPLPGYIMPAPATGTVAQGTETIFSGTYSRSGDTDGDGLTDLDETDIYGTDPARADTDGDGFNDGLEVLYAADPLNSAVFPIGDLAVLLPDGTRPGKAGKWVDVVWTGAVALGQAKLMLHNGTNAWLLADRLPSPQVAMYYGVFLPEVPPTVAGGGASATTGLYRISVQALGTAAVAGTGVVPCGVSQPFVVAPDVSGDYDGDGRADLGVYFPPWGMWYLADLYGGWLSAVQFGWNGPYPIPADYDGDGITDLAVYYPPTAVWYLLGSSAGFMRAQFGWNETVPVRGDFDGDGLYDLAIYHEPSSQWFIVSLRGYPILWSEPFGGIGYMPVSGDFDGDGIADPGVYNPVTGEWFARRVTGEILLWAVQFGGVDMDPVPADYDGDGTTDLAVYNRTSGDWHLSRSSDDSVMTMNFGWDGPRPVVADYDGDGRADVAVFYGPQGLWYVQMSASGFLQVQFGWNGTQSTLR
ncbi:MAG: VCBS repeat-containing protein [Lentisphaerae bacterium]|nr:VCBS repeat-containing protein [Lentisphaerota bacterium]